MAITERITKTAAILAALWLLVQAAQLCLLGITTNMEGQVHVNVANHLLQYGQFEAAKSWFYLIPTLLLALFIKTGIGAWGYIVVQLLASGLATVCFYRLCLHLSQQQRVAMAATALFILFIPLQVWNTFLYTDALFISGSIMFSYAVLRSRLHTAGLALLAGGLVLLTLTRPSGLLFAAPLVLYLVQQKITGPHALLKRLLVTALPMAAVVLLVNMAFKKGGGDFDVMKPWVEQHIICFMPTATGNPGLQLADTGQPLGDLIYYMWHNPLHFARLFLLRLLSFFSLARPYYSAAHNLALYAVTLPVYALALRGMLVRPAVPGRFYLLALLALYAIAIALQCDDYHSRFAMVVFPYIFYFAAAGASALLPRR